MPDVTVTNLNLDRLAARHAQSIINRAKGEGHKAKEVDNTVTKTLGVLQENGLYACALYLGSRSATEQPRATLVLDELLNCLAAMGFPGRDNKPNPKVSAAVLPYISETITGDLPRLLLAKETCEQMLTYARYGAKAWHNEADGGE